MSRSAPTRGFTLIEMMVVVAIIGIMSAIAFALSRAAYRNANVDGAMDELAEKLAGLRAAALDGRERLFVYVDPLGATQGRARALVLANPPPTWNLAGFDPTASAVGAGVDDDFRLPLHVQLATSAAGTAVPRPLQNVGMFPSTMMGNCGGAACFAIRFRANGEVRGELPAGGDAQLPGFGFVVGTDIEAESRAAKRRAIVVGFPTGIVKAYVP